jgi:hypothetical protein
VGGSSPLPRFVSSWQADFGNVAPNAALEITNGPPSRDVALVELSSPHYDASRDLLTFRIRPLGTNSDPALAGLAQRADRGVQGGSRHASLFIDNGDRSAGHLPLLDQAPEGTNRPAEHRQGDRVVGRRPGDDAHGRRRTLLTRTGATLIEIRG